MYRLSWYLLAVPGYRSVQWVHKGIIFGIITRMLIRFVECVKSTTVVLIAHQYITFALMGLVRAKMDINLTEAFRALSTIG